jgi:hypothetical protein
MLTHADGGTSLQVHGTTANIGFCEAGHFKSIITAAQAIFYAKIYKNS